MVDDVLVCDIRRERYTGGVCSLGHGMADCSYIVTVVGRRARSSDHRRLGIDHAATVDVAGTTVQQETMGRRHLCLEQENLPTWPDTGKLRCSLVQPWCIGPETGH